MQQNLKSPITYLDNHALLLPSNIHTQTYLVPPAPPALILPWVSDEATPPSGTQWWHPAGKKDGKVVENTVQAEEKKYLEMLYF